MDDLDLTTLRPEPRPEPDVVARHRAQLVAAIGAQAAPAHGRAAPAPTEPVELTEPAGHRGSTGSMRPGDAASAPAPAAGDLTPTSAMATPASPRRSHRLLAAAAALAVAAGVAGVAATRPSDGVDVTAGATSAPGTGDDLICGDELPEEFSLPPGFEGPFPGPSEHMPDDFAPEGTLVVHWRSTDQSLDVRWPAPPLGYDHGEFPHLTDPFADVPGTVTQMGGSSAGVAGPCSAIDYVVVAPNYTAGATTMDVIANSMVDGGLLTGPASPPAGG
jgi:hypothetical protein